MTYLYFV